MTDDYREVIERASRSARYVAELARLEKLDAEREQSRPTSPDLIASDIIDQVSRSSLQMVIMIRMAQDPSGAGRMR